MNADREDGLTRVIHEGMRAEIEKLGRELGAARRECRDLRIHLKDRDAHIRNLEAMLTPLLRADPEMDGIQETLG